MKFALLSLVVLAVIAITMAEPFKELKVTTLFMPETCTRQSEKGDMLKVFFLLS